MERLKELVKRLVQPGRPGDSCSASEFHEIHNGVMELIDRIENPILTCVYCGKQYPDGTPAHGSDVETLTEHIKICDKHPLRIAEKKIKDLKFVISKYVGVKNVDDVFKINDGINNALMSSFDKKDKESTTRLLDMSSGLELLKNMLESGEIEL